MPEGDTILKTARALSRALAGRRLVRFASPLPALSRADLTARTVTAVDAVGKNLLIRFDDGRVLHTHLRMHGRWYVHRAGERSRCAPSRARVVLETAEHVAVCVDAPVVRLLSAERARRDMAALGPDLLAPEFDAARALCSLRGAPRLSIGEAIMTQRLVAGVGNVYKSEVLFLARVDPRARIGALSDDALARVLAEARRLMLVNVTPGPTALARGTRRTRGGRTQLWVYRRRGEPCLRCGARVEMVRQGGALRSTYFCPVCQA
jgi:endonuclease VIII